MKKQTKDDISFNKESFILKSTGTIAKRYLKIKNIANGTYSKVYIVQNKTDFKLYCCKEILKNKLADINKFRNEINVLSKVDHPNIIRLYEVFEDERYISIIMELCQGGDLFKKINELAEKDQSFSEKEAVKIFKQLMSAVSYCHSQGICHRDLKPDNIIFLNKEPDSPIKVIDFGLSKIFGELKPIMKGNKVEKNIMSLRVGTAYYMSPEVLQGNYDNKCDIWACGVILYIMLCGYPPFDGDSEHDILKAISKKKFYFPEEEWKTVSDDAKDLIKHMICDADKRYNAEMILNHPWIEKNAPNSKGNLAKFNVHKLESFGNLYKLTKYVIGYVASRTDDADITNLKKIFEEIDTNKSGTLDINEIKNSIDKMEKEKEINEEDKETIIKNIDTDKSSKIEYNEFLAACLEQKIYLREENLLSAFMMLDLDGSGKISKAEIKQALNKDIDDETLDRIIKDFDLDGDGEIDYKEFVAGMKSCYKKEEEVTEVKSPSKKHK